MILIADSGSTKTHWHLTGDDTCKEKDFFSAGINPFYQSAEEIAGEIHKSVSPHIEEAEISSIYFYGAGCVSANIDIMRYAIAQTFPQANIEVNTDLLAAARALFGNEEGIACILGTGSNSCFYSGKQIVENVSPLGFILGDEGSGAVLGKKFIADLLKNRLPENLRQAFFNKYQTSPAQIMEAVYKRPFPNRYLAQFTYFLCEYQQESIISEMIYHSFSEFFVRNVQQYDYHRYIVSCMGSVAVCFEKILRQAASDNQINIGRIIKQPMEELVRFH